MTEPAKRVTIAAVARLAGVSPSAVSHVFNGRPNVSAATATRIRAAADELNWRPNFASRKVSGQGGRSLGLVIARSRDTFNRDPFFMRLVAGLTGPLAELGWSLALTLVQADEEEQVYRQWWGEQRVDAFLLVDVRDDDPRLALVEQLGAPAALLGAPVPGPVTAVTVRDGTAFAEAIEHLTALGHRRVTRVTDAPGLAHTRARDKRFRAAARERGVEAGLAAWAPDAEDPVADLLGRLKGATAIIVDSETIAAEIVAHAPEVGVRVPEQLSVIAWEDSWVSSIVRPRLTAFDAPVEESARTAVALLERLVRGEDVAPRTVSGRRLIVRESTAAAPNNPEGSS
ncbi:DNA-binding LacI/PurR family transcriptional regulator [Amycolatopsis lexingtonensis]|uniref:DNA-binding LacI/PurR family transcriptional regulator n=1 Tax=Amycolatopsis lexingtonensis TaxID=218822 RepID=A0ABR9HX50_9PSEU|nr:LacI family DNA-binding transcriptional regulator [Amycolatopsis lexingtonensis]MBE1495505.1 DNA-binding LacI/PurR family transcriptional regulator [Amycolatopsis lexingtonensis]